MIPHRSHEPAVVTFDDVIFFNSMALFEKLMWEIEIRNSMTLNTHTESSNGMVTKKPTRQRHTYLW